MRSIVYFLSISILCQCAQRLPSQPLGWSFIATNPLLRDRSALNKLIELIINSKDTIHIAAYQIDNPEIIQQLVKKNEEGILVEIIGDTKNDISGAYDHIREKGIRVLTGNRSGLMHHKFAIIDNEVVFSGTGNLTSSGFLKNHNHYFYSSKKSSVLLFSKEYQLLRQGYFGLEKPDCNNDNKTIFFMPQQRALLYKNIKERIRKSSGDVRFLFFSFSSDDIALEFIKLKREGKNILGIIDPAFLRGVGQESPRLNAANIQVNTILRRYSQNGYTGGKQHSKTILLNNRLSLPIIITGSFNWSESAQFVNDEVVLILENEEVSDIINTQWEQIYNESYHPFKRVKNDFSCNQLKIGHATNLNKNMALWKIIIENHCLEEQSLSYFNLSLSVGPDIFYFSVPGPDNWSEQNLIECESKQIFNGICQGQTQSIGFSKINGINLTLNKSKKEKTKRLKKICQQGISQNLKLELWSPSLEYLDSIEISCAKIL
jgi:hypothetical protein